MTKKASTDGRPCPVCGRYCKGETKTCERCGHEHHQSCWNLTGGCALFDCSSDPNTVHRD